MNHSMGTNHTAMNHTMMGPDHSNMNHSLASTTMMDHGHHGHGSVTTTSSAGGHAGGHDMGSGSEGGTGMHDMMGMGMQMFFTTQWSGTNVLFQGWYLTQMWQLVLSCIFLAVLAALYEGLKVLREHLLITYNQQQKAVAYDVSGMKSQDSSQEAITEPPQTSIRSRMISEMHILQTFLHMLQVTTSYFLMLVFMTYNVWLCLSVIVGAGLGYFLFGWKRAVINDSNEHCH